MVGRLAAFAWLSLVPPLLAQEPARVWVNTRSGVYHCPGTQYYGKTTRGEYLAEPEAQSRGYRANGGVRCTPSPPPSSGGVQALAATGLVPPARPGTELRRCQVERIVDGDTFHCTDGTKVRPIGIDAPEQGQEPYYTAAAAALASVMPVGSTVGLEYDRDRLDRSGRELAYVWIEARMVNWELARQGWVVTLPYRDTNRYEASLDAAVAAARTEGRGLWSVNGFACLPRDHRSRTC